MIGIYKLRTAFISTVIIILAAALLSPSEGFGQAEDCDPAKVSESEIKRCLSKMNAFDQRVMIENALNTEDPEKGLLLLSFASGILSPEERTKALRIALKGKFAPIIVNNRPLIESLGSYYIKMIVQSLCVNEQKVTDDLMQKSEFADCEEAKKADLEEKENIITVADVPAPPTGGFGYSRDTKVTPAGPELKRELLPGEKKKLEEEARAKEEAARRGITQKPIRISALEAAVAEGDDMVVYREVEGGAYVPPKVFDKVIEILIISGRKGIIVALQKLGTRMNEKQRQRAIDDYIGGGGNLEKMLREVPLTEEEAEIVIAGAGSRKEQRELSKIRIKPLRGDSGVKGADDSDGKLTD